MKNRFLIMCMMTFVMLVGESRASSPLYFDSIGVTGIVLGATAVKGGCMCKKIIQAEVRKIDPSRVAAAVGGHLVSAVGGVSRAIIAAGPFVMCMLAILDVSGVDVGEASSVLKTATSASNLASLVISNAGVFTSISHAGDSRSILDPKDALIQALGNTPLARFFGLWAGAFMPIDYSAGVGFTPTQNAVIYTIQLLSMLKGGLNNVACTNVGGVITLISSTTPSQTISLDCNRIASIPAAAAIFGALSRNSHLLFADLMAVGTAGAVVTTRAITQNAPATSIALLTAVPTAL